MNAKDPASPDGNVPLGTNQLAFAQTRDLGSNGYAQYLAVIPNRQDGEGAMVTGFSSLSGCRPLYVYPRDPVLLPLQDNDIDTAYSEAGIISIVDSCLSDYSNRCSIWILHPQLRSHWLQSWMYNFEVFCAQPQPASTVRGVVGAFTETYVGFKAT